MHIYVSYLWDYPLHQLLWFLDVVNTTVPHSKATHVHSSDTLGSYIYVGKANTIISHHSRKEGRSYYWTTFECIHITAHCINDSWILDVVEGKYMTATFGYYPLYQWIWFLDVVNDIYNSQHCLPSIATPIMLQYVYRWRQTSQLTLVEGHNLLKYRYSFLDIVVDI